MRVTITSKARSSARFTDSELGVRCLGLLSYLVHLAGPPLPPYMRSNDVDSEAALARFPGSKADELRALMFVLIENGYLGVLHDGEY